MKLSGIKRIDPVLTAIALLAAFLNIYNIGHNSNANVYYTTAVTSMLQNFHAFFFASLDPAGFITIDKPPVAFWVQSLFAYVFGVHGWSVILPQALAGIGSVLLIYCLTKPAFGKNAARLTSLVMALTPIAVAVSRTNNIDSLLVFTLLLATWFLFRGVGGVRPGFVILAFALIGLGFNEKMLQAYLVVPAFYLFYLLAFKSPWKKKLLVLAASTLILLGVSLSWALVVDSIPQENRPYIGGSKTNSVLDLALGYNGISRLNGMGGPGGGGGAPGPGGPGGAPGGQPPQNAGQQPYAAPEAPPNVPAGGLNASANPAPSSVNSSIVENIEAYDRNGYQPVTSDSRETQVPPGKYPDANRNQGRIPDQGGSNRPDGPGNGQGPGGNGNVRSGAFGTGQIGPLRLFQSELSGQASWLLPLVAFAALALLSGIRRKKPLDNKENQALFWLAWLIPGAVFFSIAGFYHHYYLIMLAPPIAVLAGAGWSELARLYRAREGWKSWLLPLALLSTIAFELYILLPYRTQIGISWLIGIAAAGGLTILLLLLGRKRERPGSMAITAGILVLLIGPAYWSATPLLYGDNCALPQAGPGQRGGPGGAPQGPGGSSSGINQKLIGYIEQSSSGEKCFFMTSDTSTAESYIIATKKAVVAIGGFNGGDSALSLERLQRMIKNREVKFFLIGSGQDRGPGSNSEALNWIRANCKEVDRELWQSTGSSGSRSGDNMTLYQLPD